MMNFLAALTPAFYGLIGFFAQKRELPMQRLDPMSRATVLVGFAVLLFLLVFLLAFIVLAGRWARRYAGGSSNSPRPKSSLPPEDDWAKKPLAEPEPTNADGEEDGEEEQDEQE